MAINYLHHHLILARYANETTTQRANPPPGQRLSSARNLCSSNRNDISVYVLHLIRT